MTTKITDFASLKAASAEFDRDLKALLDKYGLTMTRRNATMGAGNVTYKIVATLGTGEDAGKAEWDAYHMIYGLPKDALGKTIVMSGKTYKIVGLNGRSRKAANILLSRQPDGKTFLGKPDIVRALLGAFAKEPEYGA